MNERDALIAQDNLEKEATLLLIEIGFLLPSGTNIQQSSVGKRLVAYTKAVREATKASR